MGLSEIARPPKVKDVKNRSRLALVVTITLVVTLLVPPAVAVSATTTLLSASASYAAFSPDRDGYRDYLSMRYRLSATSRVWVRVYRSGSLVRTLRAGTRQRAGGYKLRWDGRTDRGTAAPAGRYSWVVTAKRGTTSVKRSGFVSLTRLRLPENRWIGFHVPGAPLGIAPLAELESRVETTAAVVTYFQNTSQGFTWIQAANAADHGAVPVVTLEFWDPSEGVDQPSFSLKAIAGGAWDDYLRRYAADAKSFGRPVRLRPLHEMNGNWYPWGGTVNGNTPPDFVAAWRRIRTIFAEEGAANVAFVWSPNNDSVPNTPENAIAKYWPGDAYVDFIALDGYNFGTGSSWSSWRSFGDVFGSAYATVASLSAKPIFIAETGCATTGGDKAAWIADMFRSIPQRYPRIQGVSWFNADKERDWRVESSAESLAAFKAQAQDY